MKMTIFCASHNAGPYVEPCLKSLTFQRFRDFRIFWMDDCSTDDSGDRALSFLKKSRLQYEYFQSPERKGKVAMYARALPQLSDDEIVVEVDGDDWLARPDALDIIANKYKAGAWATWGCDFTSWSTSESWHPKDMPEDPSFLRGNPGFVEHPHTSYAGLLKLIKDEDLRVGPHYADACTDRFMFCPAFEMASERVVCTRQIIYGYNHPSPTNSSVRNPLRAPYMQKFLIAKNKYERLAELPFDVSP